MYRYFRGVHLTYTIIYKIQLYIFNIVSVFFAGKKLHRIIPNHGVTIHHTSRLKHKLGIW